MYVPRIAFTVVVGSGLLALLGCGDNGNVSESPRREPSAKAVAPKESEPVTPVTGWGTVKGRVTFGGDQLPQLAELKIEKDVDHCLSKGPLLDLNWVVNPNNRGVRYAVVYFKAAKGKPLAIHETLKEPNPKEVVVDQPTCAFEPRVFAIREGQKLIAKNSSPIPHNFMIQGLKNSANIQTPPGNSHTFDLIPESGPIGVACSAHPWMRGHGWVFEHPYFAVTDENGNFEIKLVPAGKQNLVVWQESVQYVPDRNGQTVDVKPDGVLDVGEIILKPTK